MDLFKSFVLFVLFVSCTGEKCKNPTVSSSYYTNTDSKLLEDTVFVVEFDLKCDNNVENLQLFADVDGKQHSVTSSPDSEHRQVSWVVRGRSQARSYDLRLFDEEGYNNLRKALRNGQDVSSIKPLFVVEINHPGTFSMSWIKSELLALAGVSLLFYFVCRDRSRVIS